VLVEHKDLVSCVVMTGSDRSVVSGSHDTRLLVWDLDKGDVEHQLIGHTGPVTAVNVTADGSIAVSGMCSFVIYPDLDARKCCIGSCIKMQTQNSNNAKR